MIQVTFFSYTGKPTSVPKTLGTYTESFSVNLITDAFPALTVTIELAELVKGNYCIFRYPDKLATGGTRIFYWFVGEPVKFQNLYRYELSLDVLQTYWGGVKGLTQMIERSASIVPDNDLTDNKWAIGKKLGYNIYYGSLNDTTSPIKKSFPSNVRNIVLTTASNGGTLRAGNVLVDQTNHAFSNSYAISYDTSMAFSSWMWSHDLSTNLKKWFSDPAQSIISARVFPFEITNTGSQTQIVVGDLVAEDGSHPITGRKLDDGTMTIDMGYVEVHRDYNDFRDYAPYSSYKLWLPYVGYHDLNPAEFFSSGKCYIKYNVDLISGETVITLSASNTGNRTAHQIITTSLGMQLPISESGYANIQKNLLTGATNMALTMAMFHPQVQTSSTYTPGSRTVGETHSADFGGLPVPITQETNPVPYYGGYGTDAVFPAEWAEVTYTEGFTTDKRKLYFSPYSRRSWLHGMSALINDFAKPSPAKTTGNLGTAVYNTLKNSPFIIKYLVTPLNDSYQKEKYGKLVMTPSKIEDCRGYCKIHECNIEMMGLPYVVYQELVNCLESGFYIESEG